MKTKRLDEIKIDFEKFLSLIDNILTCKNEIEIIKNKLRRHFNVTTSDYLCSNEFRLLLNQNQNIFIEKNSSTKYFTLLAQFDEQLKKHSIKSSKLNRTTIETSVDVLPVTTILQSETIMSEVKEVIEYLLDQCCQIENKTRLTNESKHQRKIMKLERRLSRLSRTIRELEEKDMSLDEMLHCDLYVVEANLKQQACQIYTKLSKLKSQTTSIERIIHRPITLEEMEKDNPLMMKDLQDMVNQSKHFPNFADVLETVEKANEKYKLNLNEEFRKKFAEKSFKTIGKAIKTRRMADFNDIMYSRLPEGFDVEQNDPAKNNSDIEQVLLNNERDATIKTEKIFEEFAQIQPDPNNEINIDGTDDENHQTETMNPLVPTVKEPSMEISINDRDFTVLSTSSLPTTPRTANLTDNELLYQLYRQRLANNISTESIKFKNKRPLIKAKDHSPAKKLKKQQPDIIVLD